MPVTPGPQEIGLCYLGISFLIGIPLYNICIVNCCVAIIHCGIKTLPNGLDGSQCCIHFTVIQSICRFLALTDPQIGTHLHGTDPVNLPIEIIQAVITVINQTFVTIPVFVSNIHIDGRRIEFIQGTGGQQSRQEDCACCDDFICYFHFYAVLK